MTLLNRTYTFFKQALTLLQTMVETAAFKRKAFVTKPGTLLIVRLDSIGDYILFRNYIQAVKNSATYKNYKITLCGNSWWKALSESLDTGYVDDFIWIDYSKMTKLSYRFKLFRKIHACRFEVLIHPTYSRDVISDAVVLHSGAKIKVGYSGDTTNLTVKQKKAADAGYTTLIPSSALYLFEFYRNRYFFEQLLGEVFNLAKPHIEHLTAPGQNIIICPGAKDAFRRWSPLKFAALCSQLTVAFPDSAFTICGNGQDKAAAEAIMENSAICFADYTGKLNLIELLGLFAQAKLIITNDSGPFHMAVALNKRVVCLSNGNNYGRFTPYPEEMQTHSTVIYPPALLAISEGQRLNDFYKHGSVLEIDSIEVDTVYTAIKQLID